MTFGYVFYCPFENMDTVNNQVSKLKEFGATDRTIFAECHNNTKIIQPELSKLFDAVTEGDTIVVVEITRIAHSMKQLCDVIELCRSKRVKLSSINGICIDCTQDKLDAASENYLRMVEEFELVDKHEKRLIVNRVKNYVAEAKANGKHIGRPKMTSDDVPIDVKDNLYLYNTGKLSKKQYAEMCSITPATLEHYLNLLS